MFNITEYSEKHWISAQSFVISPENVEGKFRITFLNKPKFLYFCNSKKHTTLKIIEISLKYQASCYLLCDIDVNTMAFLQSRYCLNFVFLFNIFLNYYSFWKYSVKGKLEINIGKISRINLLIKLYYCM